MTSHISIREVASVSRCDRHDDFGRVRQHIERAAGRGRTLLAEGALRRRLPLAGRDLSPVRLHTGADAQRITDMLGADAVTSGTDIFFAADRFDPATDEGMRLIEHELAHVAQQSARGGLLNRLAARGGTYRGTASDPWERAAPGHPAAAFRARPARPGAIVQCHDSFEHRVLGDLRTADFTALGTSQRQTVIQLQLDLLWKWHQSPLSVTEKTVTDLCPWIRTLRLPASNLLVTYGELNALPDYIATAATADTLPASVLLPILQAIRQEGYRSLSALLGRAVTDQFQGAPFPPSSWLGGFVKKLTGIGLVDTISQSRAFDDLTLRVGAQGTDHYAAMLGRNACHFAPFSWYRWQASYLIACDLATQAHAAGDANAKAQLEHGAWVHCGYADHFLQDSFAAGHLCNKTLIMQWFVEWAASEKLVVVQDWDLIKDMTTAKQPGLAGRGLYSPTWAGGSNDPQTAEDQPSYLARRGAVGLAAGGIDATYQKYFAFLSSLITQASAGALHDHYNDVSLWVGSVAHPQAFEIYGDDTLLSGGGGAAGINQTSEATQLSQQSIRQLLETGSTSVTTQQLRDRFPTTVRGAGNSMLGLEAWNDTQKAYCGASIFPSVLAYVKSWFVGGVSPRIANVSVDQDMWPRWSTSLPGSGFGSTATVLPLGGRVFAASNGFVYELDAISGLVLHKLALGGTGETRLAGDSNQLYVGFAGGVRAIDLHGNWSRTAWSTGLDGADGNTVDLLAHQGRLFAGCNGYVYEVGLDGRRKHRVQLGSSFVKGDYTTSITADGTMLYAGTHGYAYGVKLGGGWGSYEWSANLTDARFTHVDVLSAGGRLFAGSYGYAYEFNPSNGHLLQKSRPTSWVWSPVGSYETHLAVAAGTLAVATHGFVYGLDLGHSWNAKSAKWQADLEDNRYQEADVIGVGGELYAGSYGYVWRIDAASGNVAGRLLLTSRILYPGDYVTRVAATQTALYAGVHGYANAVALLQPPSAWPAGQKINDVDHTPVAPGAAAFQQKLHVLFQADDPSNEIYDTASGAGTVWPSAAAINASDRTTSGVAATVFQGKLFAIHKGATTNQIWWSASSDGVHWPENKPINDTAITSASVAATVFNNKLYVLHRGAEDKRIHFTASSDGVSWPGSQVINTIDHTPLGVAAAVFHGHLYVFFRADDDTKRIYFTASADGVAWPAAQRINGGDHTPLAVAAAAYEGGLYVFFRADDASNAIRYTASTDGVVWPGSQRINDVDSTPAPLAAAVLGNDLCLFWRANDASKRIYHSVLAE
jgi:hypothetical protein